MRLNSHLRWGGWVLLFCGHLACSSPARISDGQSDVSGELSSKEVTDGSILIAHVTLPQDLRPKSNDALEVKGVFADLEIPFYPDPELGEGVYSGVLGVPYEFKPGQAQLQVRVGSKDLGRSLVLPFNVTQNTYPSETLKVSPRKVNPRKQDLPRITRESKEVGATYRQLTREKLWKGPFSLPLQTELTSVYGTRRVFNGVKKSSHNAVDFRAAVGTPVAVASNGIVALAKDLFYTGNTVIVDHGYGVMTLYAHLSKIHVKVGDRLKEGQILGLSGATGRVSGPHLHWSGILHGVKVDPMALTKVMR